MHKTDTNYTRRKLIKFCLLVREYYNFNLFTVIYCCCFNAIICISSYILNVPFNNDDESGIVYVWIGSKCDSEDARLVEEIAEDMFNNVDTII